MTEFPVERIHSVIVIGSLLHPPGSPPDHRPLHPERAALVEPRGALLYWDVLEPRAHPYAEIHEPGLAADWLWEVYGPEAADAILGGADRIAAEAESPVLDAARGLAHLRWAEAWWPSSHEAAVPALSAGLLRAEIAWRTAGVEHLLDDEEAVERALAAVDLGPVAALERHPVLGAEARDLAANLAGLAEDYGVVLRTAEVRARPQDWALAAGGEDEAGPALAGGEAPVSWEAVPQGLVDAVGRARWSLVQRAGAFTVAVDVPAAPKVRGGVLTARIGGAEIALRHDPDTGMFTGEAEVPQGLLAHLSSQRTVHVFDPAFGTEAIEVDPDAPARRAAIVAHAYGRLAAADASLAERAAALGIDAP
ncbi:hypothetical protein LO763_19040 [Glycomyces sp. A-F 0318]|uniref:hypothetical protein n=1 Tax=Glycomyces amatae TaxID=2881355 RepID=UPI001E3BA182|nr:hypothetical protein [Glycomyces amatae]MCD0445707.1 hypothetical protein [Glycomyces amatae]